MSSKVFVVIFLILFLASSVFAYLFYEQAQSYLDKNTSLRSQVDGLEQEKKNLAKDKEDYQKRSEELSSRLSDIQKELERVEEISQERDTYKRRYQEASDARDALMKKIEELREQVQKKTEIAAESSSTEPGSGDRADDYWQEVVEKKAEYQAQLEKVQLEMQQNNLKISNLESQNESLKIQLSQAQREKEGLKRKMDFNKRTIEILTKDLVREREDRNSILSEIDALKEQNRSMSSELQMVKDKKQNLQEELHKVQEREEMLSTKLDTMGTALKDKVLEIQALQEHLSSTLVSAQQYIPEKKKEEVKPVELPPIVVKSKTEKGPVMSLKGEILSVNHKENFVIVDVGSASGIVPGNKFDVLRDGQKFAELEVIETRKDIAACDIIKSSGARIREGDIVKYIP